jgi:hypothetical protein
MFKASFYLRKMSVEPLLKELKKERAHQDLDKNSFESKRQISTLSKYCSRMVQTNI